MLLVSLLSEITQYLLYSAVFTLEHFICVSKNASLIMSDCSKSDNLYMQQRCHTGDPSLFESTIC